MKTAISSKFTIVNMIVNSLYTETVQMLKIMEKQRKGAYKNQQKKCDKIIKSLRNDTKFFDQTHTSELSTVFLYESLDIFNFMNISVFGIRYLEYLDVKHLLKDKEFTIFLKHIIITDLTYQLGIKDESLDRTTNYILNLKRYFGDIRSIFLSYCLIKEKNITNIKIINITSFILKGCMIQGEHELTEKQLIILNQIQSGIKYEKIKETPLNNLDFNTYNKKLKFDILEKVKTTIKIKYISKQDYKHRFHKSPVEHERKGHYRTYKNGNKVWIQQLTINIGSAA